MLHIEKWKSTLALILTLAGVLYAVPNILPAAQQQWLESHAPAFFPHKTVNLGLDLRGGSHLLLQADTVAVMRERLQAMADTLRTDFRKAEIAYSEIGATEKGVTFRLESIADSDKALRTARALDPMADISTDDSGLYTVTLSDKALSDIRSAIINQSIEVVRRRVDESGTREPVIQRQGDDRIVVQLPGVDNPEHIKALLGKTAKMSFHLLDPEAMLSGIPGPGAQKLPMRESPGQSVVILRRIMVSGDMLLDAQPQFDQSGPVVSFKFDAAGGKRFCEVTRENIGKPFAIVLDGEVISAPVIQSEICGGSGQISGNFTVKEAADLALLLRAGALPAPLTVVEERSVGPTLGSDSIAAGKHAAVMAFVAVFAFIWATYGLFGFFANIALIFNLIFIFAVLSLFQATLTLPGIAGIILTIGIAVDANVLIYERIREELRHGRSIIQSIDTGYKLAWNTIVDANLTTLIVATILFSFGSGPIKGFAVAMCIGILTSMFSAIMLTRMMIVTWLRKTRPAELVL